jgi:hypothetical protein
LYFFVNYLLSNNTLRRIEARKLASKTLRCYMQLCFTFPFKFQFNTGYSQTPIGLKYLVMYRLLYFCSRVLGSYVCKEIYFDAFRVFLTFLGKFFLVTVC